MTSEESLERQKEYLRRRKKATRIGMKKLAKQDEKRVVKEEKEISHRPFNSFDAVEITKKRTQDDDPYDIETMFLQ